MKKAVLAERVAEILLSSMTRSSNKKLGVMITWSLPPIGSCPGMTPACYTACYARKMQRWSTVRRAWIRNFQMARERQFGPALQMALGLLPECILRLHVSGDFFSVPYIKAWKSAVIAAPHVYPFAFTRSWRVPRLMSALAEGGWPDWLFVSTDRDTEPPPPGLRIAEMSETGESTCLEQLHGIQCDACGACPTVQRTPEGQFIPLKFRGDVTFSKH